MMATTTKTVKGRTYLYFSYYDPNTKGKREIYCGLKSDPDSQKNALEFESTRLKKQKKNLNEKITILEKCIAEYKTRKIEAS